MNEEWYDMNTLQEILHSSFFIITAAPSAAPHSLQPYDTRGASPSSSGILVRSRAGLEGRFRASEALFCVIDEGIHLKVMFKTAEIHIRRAYRGQLIIRNHQFGVQEAFLIEIDLDSRIEHICQIRAGTRDASSGYQHAWATSDAHRHLTRRLSA